MTCSSQSRSRDSCGSCPGDVRSAPPAWLPAPTGGCSPDDRPAATSTPNTSGSGSLPSASPAGQPATPRFSNSHARSRGRARRHAQHRRRHRHRVCRPLRRHLQRLRSTAAGSPMTPRPLLVVATCTRPVATPSSYTSLTEGSALVLSRVDHYAPPAEPSDVRARDRRFWAAVIDVWLLSWVLGVGAQALVITSEVDTTALGTLAAFALLMATEARTGRTPGKALNGLRTRRAGGGPVGWRRAIRRRWWMALPAIGLVAGVPNGGGAVLLVVLAALVVSMGRAPGGSTPVTSGRSRWGPGPSPSPTGSGRTTSRSRSSTTPTQRRSSGAFGSRSRRAASAGRRAARPAPTTGSSPQRLAPGSGTVSCRPHG
ncbi:MAG: hypothetical protein GEU78_16880 [Actinobacteria bacterium]|nr:hypothetical protein [Actinomycetota bacterium]